MNAFSQAETQILQGQVLRGPSRMWAAMQEWGLGRDSVSAFPTCLDAFADVKELLG